MKTKFHIKLKAFFLLFIIAVSSIGVPLITHECSHNEEKDIHLFSSEHHCDDTDCEAPNANAEDLSFNETPCCSFETNFLQNNTHLVSKNELSVTQTFILAFFLTKQEKPAVIHKYFHKNKSSFYDLYGLKYRIAIQSFLC